jgi:iron complex outermembrane recepter protein
MRRISGRVTFSWASFLFFASFWSAAADVQMIIHFDLPAQSLAQTLKEIGTVTNTDVGFRANQIARLVAPSLKGDFTVDDALTRVLVGTGLRPKHLNDHTVVIVAVEASQASDSTTQQPMPAQTDTPVPESESKVTSSQGDELEQVVVTGTHIRGLDNKTNPIIVIDRDQIDRSGYSSTQDLFNSLPQNFTSGDASADGVYSANARSVDNLDYGSGINLRGLGASSTLVLLDGHRLAPSALGSFVDVSLIPLSAIDRVEILTDGSSAIYGSDAVGGVVNIILKKDYQGADTTARFGSVTNGSRHEELLAQTLGTTWSGGNIVGTLQYQQQSALPANERDFASALPPSPNDLLPETRSYGATLVGRQTITDGLEFYGDVLLSQRDFTHGNSIFEGSPTLDVVDATYSDGTTQTVDITPGLRYQLSDRWSIELNTLYARQKTTDVQPSYTSTFGIVSTPLSTTESDSLVFTEKSVDLNVNGHVAAMPAGDIGLAAGMSYRTEDFDAIDVVEPGNVATPTVEDRNITAAFAELYVPIVGRKNHIPMVEALEFSAAVRLDHYSDFGSTTNPRIGLHWAPWTDLSVRASYGTSFQAPTAADEFSEQPLLQAIIALPPLLASPTGGLAPVLEELGSKTLTAQRARTEDVSIEYKPSGIEGLIANVGYYYIRYTDRIITPTFSYNALIEPNIYGSLVTPVPNDAAAQAIIDSAVAAGNQYLNASGTGATGIRYLLDLQQQNASEVIQSGFDITSRYARPIASHTLIAQLNISYIDKIDTQLASGAAFDNLVNTFANPVKWRGRLDLAWASSRWSVGGALNQVGSYVNTATVGNPSIASWTTVDLNATINADAYIQGAGWKGVSLSLTALNALNRNPPFVDAPSLINVNFDPENASPLGRFVALTVKKKW